MPTFEPRREHTGRLLSGGLSRQGISIPARYHTVTQEQASETCRCGLRNGTSAHLTYSVYQMRWALGGSGCKRGRRKMRIGIAIEIEQRHGDGTVLLP